MATTERTRELLVPLLLGSLVLFAIFLGLEPLLLYAAWGSDSGEYATLTTYLLTNGRFLLTGYHGWGFGYPYFPGTFEVGAGIASATGVDPLLSLELAIPTFAALGSVPCFLLFRRLVPSDVIALTGAALTAVAAGRILIISHAAPQSLGDLLWFACLWLLVEQRRDPRWWALLAPLSAALILTHHLSSYFFLLSGIGLIVGLELYQPLRWSRRFPLRELVFLGGFTTGLFAYWEGYAPAFGRILTAGLGGGPPWLIPSGVILFLVLSGAAVHLRRHPGVLRRDRGAAGRRTHPAWPVHWPTERRVLRDGVLLGALMAAGVAAIFFVPIPGTAQHATLLDLAYYLPVLLFIPVAAGNKGLLPTARLGPGALAVLGVVGLSALFAIATNNQSIPADRHIEFILPPLALLTACGLGRVLALPPTSQDRGLWFAVLGLTLGLVVSNAVAAYPPPAAIEGFQEGFTPADLSLAAWAGQELPPGASLAADHRLSDLYFLDSGGRGYATWNNASCLFNGNDPWCARAELNSSYLPNIPFQGTVDAVAYDATMVQSGVALNPSNPALPMSASALARLHGSGFIELYDAGGQALFWVDTPSLPPA